jgi:hypothetical protein
MSGAVARIASVRLDIADPRSWPVRMLRGEVAAVLRISERELRRRINVGRIPPPDDGRTWSRTVVESIVNGTIRELERKAAQRRLRVVGGDR